MNEAQTILSHNELEKASRRAAILAFQENMQRRLPGVWEGDNDHCPLKHTFPQGFYVREIFLPKGTLLVGKIHRHEHPNFLMSGDVSVLTEEGPKRIKGPCSMVSPAGTKRIVYAHEDTVWVTVHLNPDNLTDLKALEELIIAKNYEELTHHKTEDKL